MKRFRLLLIFTFALMALHQPVRAQGNQPLVLVMNADGDIMPPMLEYIQRGIRLAEQQNAEALVIQLNTPGGSIETMKEIVGAIRNSQVPVVIYVAPRGAWAASAGALITMAGHASAMAPETTIGAVIPISNTGNNLDSDLRTKEINTLKETIRPFVEPRGEAALALANAMIEKGESASAAQALDAKLIDFVAADMNDLLKKLDGFTVHVGNGARTLHTSNARTEPVPMTFIEQFLFLIIDPNIDSILMTVGMLALYFEFSHPGGWVSGFIGVICIALAIYGGGSLALNWFGGIFIVMAFVLFVLDIKAPTHGALTTAGVGSFIFGMLMLFNSTPASPFEFQPRVSVPLVVGIGVTLGGLVFVVMTIALRARHAPIRMGVETYAGKSGTVRTWADGEGQVQLESEQWSAEAADGSGEIRKGDKVEVVEVKGLRLKVRKK